jgi:uncharacterized 2Fe-2S/4Fe-4S cluster protein (DUF4445 family)
VRIEGTVPPVVATGHNDFSPEEIAQGWRRACRSVLSGACTVHVPAHTTPILNPPGQDDGPAVVSMNDPVLRSGEQAGFWQHGEHRIGPIEGPALGLAVDLGTTNIAAALVDMVSGKILATGAQQNPQSVFGADIITRMTLAVHDKAAALELQQVDVKAIEELGAKLSGGHPESIAEVAVVGNSVMQHLLLGLPLDTLSQAPYRPHTLSDMDVAASSLGMGLAPGARLYAGPYIAGFVGGDHVSALFETLVDPPQGRWMLMDIGTNTEISLYDNGKFVSVSCASGPAFEGGMLSCGMRAMPGAITSVRLEGGEVRLTTFGKVEPVGICGSGVISLLSELLGNGVIDRRGRLSLGNLHVREQGGRREFVLFDKGENGSLPVVFTQEDVRTVQLAKAAIRTGLDLLQADAGMEEMDLDRLIIAGAFGKFLDVKEAMAVGLIPSIPERIVQVGNAAGAGVRRLLVSNAAREKARQLARHGRYLELATRPEFYRTFAARAMF